MTTYLVAVYDVALASGGSEEGGWWYQCGSLVRVCCVFRHEERAYQYCRRLNDRLDCRSWGPNLGRREMSSVLSDGEYRAMVHEDMAPAGFPEHRPHYE